MFTKVGIVIPPYSFPTSFVPLAFFGKDPNRLAFSLPSTSPSECDPSHDPLYWDEPRHSMDLD